MYWENQLELTSGKGSNRSRGATRDIGSGPLKVHMSSPLLNLPYNLLTTKASTFKNPHFWTVSLWATFYVGTLGRKLTNQITVISYEKECGLFNA